MNQKEDLKSLNKRKTLKKKQLDVFSRRNFRIYDNIYYIYSKPNHNNLRLIFKLNVKFILQPKN